MKGETNSRKKLSNWISIPVFNWNVIIFQMKILGLGFVYRRKNVSPWKFVWSRFDWNAPYNCWAWSARQSFKGMFKPIDLSE